MFEYLDMCFVDTLGVKTSSLENCFRWDTIKIDGNEEVFNVNSCFNDSFQRGIESDNSILKADREWAQSIGVVLHPSIVINNQTFFGDVNGKGLATRICLAYNEAPDECELSWKINSY